MERFAMRTRAAAAAEKEKESLLPLSSLSNATTTTAETSSSTSPKQHNFYNNHNDDDDEDNHKRIKHTDNVDSNKDKSSSNNGSISRMGLMVLVLLAVQNCSKNLVVRHVMAQQPQFLTSAAVLSSECIKLACSVLYIVLIQKQSLHSIWHYMRNSARHSLLLVVPASAYNLQMSLEYVALANLNAAMFSVLVQTKLLCTALFASIVLRKRLKRIQVVSLVLLTTGVMLCNMQNNGSGKTTAAAARLQAIDDGEEEEQEEAEYGRRQTKGILATLGIALSSGFASVYTEKFIKGDQQQQQLPASSSSSLLLPPTGAAKDKQETTEFEALRRSGSHDKDDDDPETPSPMTPAPPTSSSASYGLAYTQVQLAVMSIVTIGLYAAMMDWHDIVTNGLFYHFSHGAIVSVCMSALGGLIVASVLKHADSILKGYATALSVILTGILSRMIFDTQLSTIYFMGIINVVTAVILYNGQDLNQYVC